MITQESLIIKQSPIVIIKNFVFFEFVAITAFFAAAALANYVAIYRTLFFSNSIPFHIAELLFVTIFQTALIFYIFLRWYKNYYDIKQDHVIHGWGIFFKHREVIPMSSFTRVSYHSGPLAKLLKYGTIDLIGPHLIRISNIPEPREHSELLIRLKQNLTSNSSVPNHRVDIRHLMAQPEHESLEFKSSFRWDHKENRVNRGLEKAAMKTVAAFLNSHGGNLVLGVDDKKNVVGVSCDYKTLPRPDADSFENHFSQVFHTMIGPEFRQFVRLSNHQVGDQEVCLISVQPSKNPVYLKTDGDEEFYIRTGNKTTSLKFSEASKYIDAKLYTS